MQAVIEYASYMSCVHIMPTINILDIFFSFNVTDKYNFKVLYIAFFFILYLQLAFENLDLTTKEPQESLTNVFIFSYLETTILEIYILNIG